MKITLKNLKIAEHMSEETTAFTADLIVDGVNVGSAKNGGHGGSTDYRANEGKRELLKKAEEFCKTLPPLTGNFGSIDMNLEHFIDELVYQELLARDEKNRKRLIEKQMETSIMWGIPNDSRYVQVKFKTPLSQIPIIHLQGYIDTYKKELKKGEVFLNTNLEKLGVKL